MERKYYCGSPCTKGTGTIQIKGRADLGGGQSIYDTWVKTGGVALQDYWSSYGLVRLGCEQIIKSEDITTLYDRG